MRGAEAVLSLSNVIGRKAVVKCRAGKKYRMKEIDNRLRSERTRSEARLLNKAKIAGVICPTVLEIGEFEITMGFIEGGRPEMDKKNSLEAGKILAKLHEADIIHGDYTPANLIEQNENNSRKLVVIDFGLGFVSNDVEDKAIDVFTMLRALGESGSKAAKDSFIQGYQAYSKAKSVLERVKDVEKRVRYAF